MSPKSAAIYPGVIGLFVGVASVKAFAPDWLLAAVCCVVLSVVGLCVYRAVRYTT